MKSFKTSVSVFFRFVILFFLFLLPFSVAGFLIDSKMGLIIGLGIGYLFFLWMLFRSEDGIALIYNSAEIKQVGYQRTFDRVIFELGDQWEWRPRLLVFRDPAPALLVFRRPGTEGTVLISQGLVPLLSEAELRCLFQIAIKRTRDQGIALSTFSAYLSALLFKLAPRSWALLTLSEKSESTNKDSKKLGILSSVWFSMVYAGLRLLAWIGDGSNSIATDDPIAFAAVQKINQALQTWGPTQLRGAFGSHLTWPVAFNSLVNP